MAPQVQESFRYYLQVEPKYFKCTIVPWPNVDDMIVLPFLFSHVLMPMLGILLIPHISAKYFALCIHINSSRQIFVFCQSRPAKQRIISVDYFYYYFTTAQCAVNTGVIINFLRWQNRSVSIELHLVTKQCTWRTFARLFPKYFPDFVL